MKSWYYWYMRKPLKDKLFEYLNSLSQAGDVAAKVMRQGAFDELRDLLAQMQELAIAAGTEIEASESAVAQEQDDAGMTAAQGTDTTAQNNIYETVAKGDGEEAQDGADETVTLSGKSAEAVHILEEYCEQLYAIGALCDEDAQRAKREANKQIARLNGLLRREKDALNAIPLRREVVFLPYKASMWDSLESVWKAADADPDCDAYVVPIPYYDKNPDGSFREVHYEGDLYPPYVPVTHYNDYDFAARRPDIIFIHNPYDEINYVTSVHPFFYSKHLKEFTDRLVYIPYFLLGDVDPDDPESVKGMETFATVPGVLFADYTIVQSEDMAKAYLKALAGYFPKEYAERYEGRILGLGSPKLDKVLSTSREELSIPDDWKRVLQKEDGSFKKVIFYNTTITGILNGGGKSIEKMRRVFDLFREQKDEIALLWRPHPLIEATLTSMRPALWDAYRTLRDEYVQEGFGIFDDTPDMDRAVILCDAYYGDGSSIVWLCRAAGKPVMIQNVEV